MFMKKYRKHPVTIEAAQWFGNGDHPQDECPLCHDEEGKPFLGEGKVVRRYRHPLIPAEAMCSGCEKPMGTHGWLDTPQGGQIVCPGDYVINDEAGHRSATKPAVFAATYEPVEQ